jgi:ABC-type sulfate transport system substrate-binding protein
MSWTRALNIFAIVFAIGAVGVIAGNNLHARASYALLNVSYDPTRELYAKLNPAFVAAYEKSGKGHVEVKQAHGGSSRQARKVVTGELAADVVTLGLPSDVEALRKQGLIKSAWTTSQRTGKMRSRSSLPKTASSRPSTDPSPADGADTTSELDASGEHQTERRTEHAPVYYLV